MEPATVHATPREWFPSAVLLLLLVSGDLAFIGGDLLMNILAVAPSPDMGVATDRGHPEFYQYTKFIWLLLLTGLLIWRLRSWSMAAWIPVFLYLLADDALSLHETLGGRLASAWGLPAALGLRPIDFGELIVSATSGTILAAALVAGLVTATTRIRRLFLDIGTFLAVLAFFGVVLDMVHMWLRGLWWQLFSLVEDGGEMVVVSFLTAYLFHVLLTGRAVGLWRLDRGSRLRSTDSRV